MFLFHFEIFLPNCSIRMENVTVKNNMHRKKTKFLCKHKNNILTIKIRPFYIDF